MPPVRHRPTPSGRSPLKPANAVSRRHVQLQRSVCLSCALLLPCLDSTARVSAVDDPHQPHSASPSAVVAPAVAPVPAHSGQDLDYALPHPEQARATLCAQGPAVGITLAAGAVLQWPAHLGGAALVRGPARTGSERVRLASRISVLLPALAREGPLTARVASHVQSVLCPTPAMPHAAWRPLPAS